MRTAKALIPLVVFAAALTLFATLNGRPATPTDPARRQAVVVRPGAPTDERIAALRANVRRGAGRPGLLAELGNAYLQKARENGDPTNYTRADRVFAQALKRNPEDVDAILGLGTLELARHHFREGLVQARRAVALAPEAAGPLPTLVDALVELGRYDEANTTLQRLLDRKPGQAAYARASYVRELRGDLKGAATAMRLAVDAGSATPEGAASVQTLLGNLERSRGRLGPSARAYRAALRAQPGYPGAQAGLAGIEAARGRLGPAIARLRAVEERQPSPERAVLLGEMELAAGRPRPARAALDSALAQRRELVDNGENTDTESAAFQADHGDPAAGVRLGRRAWAAAPSVRSADALGWALARAGRPREGYAWARRALRFGWRDPLPLYHAGMSAKAAGEHRDARRLLGRLLAQSPEFSPLYAPRARRALKALR